jgi:hypothetical protein
VRHLEQQAEFRDELDRAGEPPRAQRCGPGPALIGQGVLSTPSRTGTQTRVASRRCVHKCVSMGRWKAP